jgi:hypothetical protein
MKFVISEPNKIPPLLWDPKGHKSRVLRQLVPSTSSQTRESKRRLKKMA